MHAEVEGGPYAKLLEILLPQLNEIFIIAPMHEHITAFRGSLPTRNWALQSSAGRAFPVSTALPIN